MVERRRDSAASAEDCGGHGAVRRPACSPGVGVDGEDLVAATLEHGAEQPTDEAVADDQHASVGDELRAPQDAGERLDHRPLPIGPVRGQVDRSLRVHALGEAARPDRRRANRSQSDSCPARTAFALSARGVVDERDPASVGGLGHDLVTEHDSGVPVVELLDVRAAQATRDDPHRLAGAVGLGNVGERRLPVRP